jgi:hypothetical protein
MKKDELLGMEVFYEDNPQRCEPRGHKGVEGVEGIPAPKRVDVWAFGDSDEEDDFDDVYGECDNYDVYEQESHPIPIKGRIYSVDGLNVTAKLKEIRPLTKTAGILEMSHHDNIFYINPSALRKASPEQVERYLEESDYDNTP